jgi:hypothetical protein
LAFLRVHDQAMMAAKDVVDMPDRRASLLVRLIVQNQGKLSRSKRPHFAEISDQELLAVEAAIQRVIARTRDLDGQFVEELTGAVNSAQDDDDCGPAP